MHHFQIQWLTWGTIAAAVGSALLLGALDGSRDTSLVRLPQASRLLWSQTPPQAARPGPLRSNNCTSNACSSAATERATAEEARSRVSEERRTPPVAATTLKTCK